MHFSFSSSFFYSLFSLFLSLSFYSHLFLYLKIFNFANRKRVDKSKSDGCDTECLPCVRGEPRLHEQLYLWRPACGVSEKRKRKKKKEKEKKERKEKQTERKKTKEKKLTSLFRYYETIAGGAGAGPTWHGTSAVQVHMTNTRITGIVFLFIFFPFLSFLLPIFFLSHLSILSSLLSLLLLFLFLIFPTDAEILERRYDPI